MAISLRKLTSGKDIESISNSEGGFNYYLFVATDGAHTIMRANTALTEFRYFISGSNKAENWTNRTTLLYVTPSEHSDNY